jgi:type I restriction enzyme S subunit
MSRVKALKQTDMGFVPKEWDVKELKEVVEINKESRDPTREFADKKFFYIDIDSIENSRGIIRSAKTTVGKEAPSRARRLIHYNDVIMSTVRPYLRAFAIVPREYDNEICSTGFAVFTCKEKILPLYLLYTLFSKPVIEQCNRMMVGGQYPALNNSQVEKILLPLPPLPEQKKIAEILSSVDEAIEKVDEAIKKTNRLKKGLMQELLTGRRDTVDGGRGKREFKQTEIGRIPKDWEVVRLGKSAEIIMGQSPSGDTYNEKMDGLPLINGPTEFGDVHPIPLKWTTRPRKTSKKGDILICVRGHTTGRLNISDGVYCAGRGIAIIRSKEAVSHNMYIYYILERNREKIYGISYAAGSTFPNITNAQLNKLIFPVPPLSEQKKIAEILSTVDKRFELLRSKRERLERVKKGLMNDLLSGNKRVKNLITKEEA